MKKFLLLTAVFLATASPTFAKELPCKCSKPVKRSAPVENTLVYTPEQFNGQGCVVTKLPVASDPPGGNRGIAASHSDAVFRFVRTNHTGRTFKPTEFEAISQGRLSIYRHVSRGGKVYEELVQTLTASVEGRPRDVAEGQVIQSIYFPWEDGSKAPAGDYVARMEQPSAGAETRFKLAAPGQRR